MYVRHDANLEHAIENIVDGAYFNSGQSCCGLQRVYVHHGLYQKFTEGFIELTRKYNLGDPTDAATTLGPLVRTAAADGVRAQIDASIAAGATRRASPNRRSSQAEPGTPYLAPQVLLNVDHRMPVMREEIFGPVAGIMKVSSDDEAVDLMNDSDFGLTAAIWTEDADAALRAGPAREHRHLVHEPLRLPRSGARLGGREGFGPRLYAVGGRLRTSDAAQVISHETEDIMTHSDEGQLELPDARLVGPGTHRRTTGGLRRARHRASRSSSPTAACAIRR